MKTCSGRVTLSPSWVSRALPLALAVALLAACGGERAAPTAAPPRATDLDRSQVTASPTTRAVSTFTAAATATTERAATPVSTPTSSPVPSATVSRSSPTATPRPAVRPRFVVEEGVEDADVATIVTALEMTTRYLNGRLGGQARDRIVVIVTRGRLCASEFHGGDGVICVDTGHQGWRDRSDYEKVATVAHEYFHNLQTEIGCRFFPIWLAEGSAEYFGYLVAVDNGLVDIERVRSQHLARVRSAPRLPPLESGELLNDAATYSLRFLAVDQLLGGDDLRPYRQYCEQIVAGESAGAAFEAAFGESFEAFYERFADYRAEHGL